MCIVLGRASQQREGQCSLSVEQWYSTSIFGTLRVSVGIFKFVLSNVRFVCAEGLILKQSANEMSVREWGSSPRVIPTPLSRFS
jgi:hypothetical protein